MNPIPDARSGVANANIQEILDAGSSNGAAMLAGQAQYQTPEWLANACSALLPHSHYLTVLDPQGASGVLVNSVDSAYRFVIELDNRFHVRSEMPEGFVPIGKETVRRITGNCVRVAEINRELYGPNNGLKLECIVANPPFGLRWKVGEGAMDSTDWTWQFITDHLSPRGGGYLIANINTLRKLKITEHPWVYLVQEFPAGGIWGNVAVPLGIVHFQSNSLSHTAPLQHVWTHVPTEDEIKRVIGPLLRFRMPAPYTYGAESVFDQLGKAIAEERGNRPKFNIYLGKDGILKTYLSIITTHKMQRHDVVRLARINGCHPLTLTTEKETRQLLNEFLASKVYTIEPAAKQAIYDAILEMGAQACPITPITDFELVAYTDEEEALKSIGRGIDNIKLTPGKTYPLTTGTYNFKDCFTRKKLHWDEETGKTELEDHECELSGQDRFVQIVDDNGAQHRFMDRPPENIDWHHPESMLWELFQRPAIKTVAEAFPEAFKSNRNKLLTHAMLSGFTYYEGQLDYYARVACKNYGLVGADVGCHAKGTPIMMHDGRNKLVEDIVPGDRLMGWDNTPRRVTQLSRGRQQMARITPIKGGSFVVNIDHILTLVQTNVHHSRKLASTNGTVVDVTVRDYLKWSMEKRDNHKLFRHGIELPQREVLFSPYFMGLYLGDGSSSGDQVEVLNLLGVTGEGKFIPDRYKINSRSVRLQVLAGLLDTDGHLDRCGTFDYISQSKRLADDVVWLARSLGLAAYVKACQKRDQNGGGGTYHRVCISGDVDMIPTRIPRKQAKPRLQKKNVLRTGFDVDLLPEDDFYGFSIEGDGRFLMGDFTVTHNTGKTLGALSLIALRSPKRSLIVAPQGTMRSSGDEDGTDYQASQWVQEIHRFAPGEPVFQIFSKTDYYAILRANAGEFPPGIYITYPQAYWQNDSFEHVPESWEPKEEEKFRKRMNIPFPEDTSPDDYLSTGIGITKNGIRCVCQPSLATVIAAEQDEWDMVIIDEAHLCFPYATEVMTRELGAIPIGRIVEEKLDVSVLSCNLGSHVTQWKKVTGHFKNSADRPLVKVTHEHGSFICTDDHKVRVGSGWKRAQTLVHGEELQVLRHSIPSPQAREVDASVLLTEMCGQGDKRTTRSEGGYIRHVQEAGSLRNKTMPSMSGGVHVQVALKEIGADEEVLRKGVCVQVEGEQPCGDCECQEVLRPILGSEGGKESRIIGAHEEKQPDEQSSYGAEGSPGLSGPHVLGSGRERCDDTPAANHCDRVGLANGSGDQDSASYRTLPVSSSLLQGGRCERGTETGNRGGRPLTPSEEVEISGPPQREHLEFSRVVSVEVIQQRGGIPDREGRGMDHVYCLEVEDNHNFFADGVLVSNCCNLDAQVTQNLLRLQPKMRYAMTATPIPNFVFNLFSLLGWLCVPNWYKGGMRNAAWPYAVNELHRFKDTFMSTETDITAQTKARLKGDKKWRGKGVKESAIISAPARLLKLLKPSMAYISKEACNPNLMPCEVIDVRVPMGKEQAVLYAKWLNRSNYMSQYKNPLTIALVQLSRLRGVCASPQGVEYNHGICNSDFNPKTIAVLELIRDCLRRGEQVVVVSARCEQSSVIARRLRDANVPIARIDSTVPPDLHSAEANRFKKGDAKVMLMGIKCAQGHSFDQCPNLIIGSLEWSYGSLHQAKGRVWRLTSGRPVKVWCVLHKNTIEELLFDRVATKQDAATICLRGMRVPRDYMPVDASEVLAEHIVDYEKAETESELVCENLWPALRSQLVRRIAA